MAGTFYGNDFEIDGNAARNNYDNKEVFIAKLNAQGKGIWIKTPDGRHELADNSFNDLKVDNAGNAYGFGRYNFDVKIGPNNLSATNGSYDLLLMQVVD